MPVSTQVSVTVYQTVTPMFLRLLKVQPVRVQATGGAQPCSGVLQATCGGGRMTPRRSPLLVGALILAVVLAVFGVVVLARPSVPRVEPVNGQRMRPRSRP